MLIVLFCVVVYISRQPKYHHQCCNEMFGVDTPQSANTLDLCKKACDADSTCKGFMYTPTTNTCVTKSSFTPNQGNLAAGTNTYYVTGLQTAPYTTTTTYNATPGMTYDNTGIIATAFNSVDNVNCSLACQNVANCIGYVYDTNSATPCTLHQTFGTNSYVTGATTYLSSAATAPLPRQYTLVPNVAYTN